MWLSQGLCHGVDKAWIRVEERERSEQQRTVIYDVPALRHALHEVPRPCRVPGPGRSERVALDVDAFQLCLELIRRQRGERPAERMACGIIG